MSSITIQLIGITDLDTDCIVNAANSHLAQGSGVCSAIFRAAGARDMQAACDKIGGYPKDKAWREALQSCIDWINSNVEFKMDIIFAVLDDSILVLGKDIFRELSYEQGATYCME